MCTALSVLKITGGTRDVVSPDNVALSRRSTTTDCGPKCMSVRDNETRSVGDNARSAAAVTATLFPSLVSKCF
jgi:hypothetical protein